jgi:hypothetical protein
MATPGIKISQLPSSTMAQLSDIFPMSQSGVTYSESLQQVAALFQGMQFFKVVDQTTSTAILAPQTYYITDNGATTVTYTLPTVAPLGSIIWISGKSPGLFAITQNAGQSITFGDISTTVGVGGSLVSQNIGDFIALACIAANTTFQIINSIGNFNYI